MENTDKVSSGRTTSFRIKEGRHHHDTSYTKPRPDCHTKNFVSKLNNRLNNGTDDKKSANLSRLDLRPALR